MSETFTKLFRSILDSSLWVSETDRTRLVWITMLAMADREGYVGASVPGLAHAACVPVEDVRVALERFMSPDPDSRTRDHEGRRIEEADRGWRILNYGKFREMRDAEMRRARDAERKRQSRARAKGD